MKNSLVYRKFSTLLEMIKFSHTIFAFPIALIGVLLATIANGSLPGFSQMFWIVCAMVGARSCAMALNRLIDSKIDAKNPRTSSRHIPTGQVSVLEALAFIVATGALLLFSAWMLNPLCFYLAPVLLAWFVLYAYSKRFTRYAHVILGTVHAMAPIGAWIALRGDIGWPVISLGLAALFWVAGFDIFYSLQDYDFDVAQGLHSVPARMGIDKAFTLARGCHLLMIIFLLLVYPGSGFGSIYLIGVGVVALMLLIEHCLVRPSNLSKLNVAFFNMNGVISVLIFLFALTDYLMAA